MRRKLLVIDDDDGILDLMVRLFKTDYEVLTASTGEKGLELVLTERPFLVFLDSNLPGQSGLEILGKIKKCVPDCSVWMLSGEDEEALGAEAMPRGADGCMCKPFRLETVLGIPKKILALTDPPGGSH